MLPYHRRLDFAQSARSSTRSYTLRWIRDLDISSLYFTLLETHRISRAIRTANVMGV